LWFWIGIFDEGFVVGIELIHTATTVSSPLSAFFSTISQTGQHDDPPSQGNNYQIQKESAYLYRIYSIFTPNLSNS